MKDLKEFEIQCPKCNGIGWYKDHTESHYANQHDIDCSGYGCPIQVACEECKGTGKLKQQEAKNG